MKLRTLFTALPLPFALALTLGLGAGAAPATAGDGPGRASECAYFVFAGAYRSYRRAASQAAWTGGEVRDLDASNSPNAGRGFYVITRGQSRDRAIAERLLRRHRHELPRDAYVAHRCFHY